MPYRLLKCIACNNVCLTTIDCQKSISLSRFFTDYLPQLHVSLLNQSCISPVYSFTDNDTVS